MLNVALVDPDEWSLLRWVCLGAGRDGELASESLRLLLLLVRAISTLSKDLVNFFADWGDMFLCK